MVLSPCPQAVSAGLKVTGPKAAHTQVERDSHQQGW